MPFSQCRVGNLSGSTLAHCQSDPTVGPPRTVRAIKRMNRKRKRRRQWGAVEWRRLQNEFPERRDSTSKKGHAGRQPMASRACCLPVSLREIQSLHVKKKNVCRVCQCHCAHSGIEPGWLVGSRAQPVSSKTDGQRSGQHVPSGQRKQAHQTRRMFLTGILWAGLVYELTLSWGLRGRWDHLRRDRERWRAAPPCQQ